MIGGNLKNAITTVVTAALLAGCAGSPLGSTLQQSLEADPQLEEVPPFAGTTAATAETENTDSDSEPLSTSSSDTAESPQPTTAPDPGEPGFIGPTAPARTPTPPSAAAPSTTSSLTGVPADLQPYIRDLEALDVLKIRTSANAETAAKSSPFAQTITRREYARWLFESYNTIFADESGDRLRPGNATSAPAFKDIPTTDPDFAAIQGLAEAGIIPSAWTGNSTAVNFRPDAPLVREDLLLWKVPLDTRAALPKTTPEAVTEAWGFQDVDSIDPLALRAIAADYQLGDFSNIRRAFGYTTLFRPDTPVTRAEAAAVLWRFGSQTDGQSANQVTSTESSVNSDNSAENSSAATSTQNE